MKSQIVATETMAPVRAGISIGRLAVADRHGAHHAPVDGAADRPAPAEAAGGAGAGGGDRTARAAAASDPDRLATLRAELELALRRLARVPWIDPVDLRYRRFTQVPKPSARAVMFCLMDVSGSMSEQMKDLAKRFFLLLHVFLERRYKRVELVFIRHTEVAEEVDEETFFTDPRTGGTVVSTALAEFIRIQQERYPTGFVEHLCRPGLGRRQFRQRHAAGGGDAGGRTSCRWCSISPISRSRRRRRSSAARPICGAATRRCRDRAPRLAMRRVSERRDIFPVFRDLFGRKRG